MLSKLIQLFHNYIPHLSPKFGNILKISPAVMSFSSILHLRMRSRKLPYDLYDFDMGPSEAQPAPNLQIWTTFWPNHTGKNLKRSRFCACPVKSWLPTFSTLFLILSYEILDLLWNFEHILTIFTEVMSVKYFTIAHAQTKITVRFVWFWYGILRPNLLILTTFWPILR